MSLAGYRQSQQDHSLFVKHDMNDVALFIVYVDDIVITESSATTIDTLKKFFCIQSCRFRILTR